MKIIERNRIGIRTYLTCLCTCGVTFSARQDSIKSGAIKSCGCLHKATARQQGLKNKRHGASRRLEKTHTEYVSWCHMRQRCLNPNNPKYRLYGGRGITICDSWLSSYETFLKDMGRKPEAGFTLDRINVNGNYEPSNCRWADYTTQANNRRNNRSGIRLER